MVKGQRKTKSDLIGKVALLVTDEIHDNPAAPYDNCFPIVKSHIQNYIHTLAANSPWYKKAYIVRIEKEIDLSEVYERVYGKKNR